MSPHNFKLSPLTTLQFESEGYMNPSSYGSVALPPPLPLIKKLCMHLVGQLRPVCHPLQ